MAEQSSSPFSGLGGTDKALLRSTSRQPVGAQNEATEAMETAPASPQAVAHRKVPNKPAIPRNGEQASIEANPPSGRKASLLASVPRELIEQIRKTVKPPGREVSFVRLSAQEKARLADIVYAYKRRGQRISETDVHRIALNLILDDYTESGDQSFLAKVLAALLA